MCLAIPGKVVEVKSNGKAVVEQGSLRREAFNSVIDAKQGEYVLLQQGFIVERLTEKEAKEALGEL